MGHTVTPKYALDLFDVRLDPITKIPREVVINLTWDIKSYGRPTDENLEEFVKRYAKSLEIGGTNEHISRDLGHIPYPRRAVIRYNHNHGNNVVEWKAPAFMVW